MIAMSLDLNDINNLDKPAFVHKLGFVFEHSPWVADAAWYHRPFSSLTELHQAMISAVEHAEWSKKLDLIEAHPDLAGKVHMTKESQKEQSSAGLDQLSEAESKEFLELNKAYTEKFRIPFIVAVKENTKDEIKDALKERLMNNRETEINTALQEIYKIARYRLEDI